MIRRFPHPRTPNSVVAFAGIIFLLLVAIVSVAGAVLSFLATL